MVTPPTSPTPDHPPAGLTAWRRRLAAVTLPLLSPPAVIETLLAPDPPTMLVLDVLHRDQPLGLAVLLEAQKRLGEGRQVVSLSHALGVLGLGGLQAVVRRMATQPLNPTQPGHHAYAEAVATSRLAAHLAAQFAVNDTLDERLRKMWDMPVQMMAEWRLPLAAPKLAQQMALRIAAGERPGPVEQALLGCRMSQLNAAMAIDGGLWEKEDRRATQALDLRRLAQAARLAWTDAAPPAVPAQLGRWLSQPSTLPGLLYLLAHEGMRNWYSRRTRLLQNALSAQRRWRMDEVVAATRHAAVAASREMLTSGVLVAPAARLFWAPWVRPKRGPGAAATAGQAAPAPARQATPQRHSIEPGSPTRSLIDRFMDDCAGARHPDLGAFMQAFEHTLAQGLGLQRFALFLKTSQAEQLVCFVARGFGPALVPRQYVVTLADGNLLARVFSQPHGFFLGQGERLPSLRQRLPQGLRQELHGGGAIWGAIQVRERPVGVAWADGGAASDGLDEAQYAGFKLVCRHFGAALTRLMQQQKTQAREVALGSAKP